MEILNDIEWSNSLYYSIEKRKIKPMNCKKGESGKKKVFSLDNLNNTW